MQLMRGVAGSPEILILQLHFRLRFNLLSDWGCTCHSPVLCDLVNLFLFTTSKSGHFCFAAVPDLKGPPSPLHTTSFI